MRDTHSAFPSRSLSYNRLSGFIFPAIGLLTNLLIVWVSGGASLESLVLRWMESYSLSYLLWGRNLEHNDLIGPIPNAFGRLTALRYLYVTIRWTNYAFVFLEGEVLSSLPGGRILRNNKLTGPLPDSLGELINLQILQVIVEEGFFTSEALLTFTLQTPGGKPVDRTCPALHDQVAMVCEAPPNVDSSIYLTP